MEEIDGDFSVGRAGSTGCHPTWAYIVIVNGDDRYMRNPVAANNEAKAHLPFVPPTKPDNVS
jgi:hypothetical protein